MNVDHIIDRLARAFLATYNIFTPVRISEFGHRSHAHFPGTLITDNQLP